MTRFERRNIGGKLLAKYQAQGIRRTLVTHGHAEQFGDGGKAQAELFADAAGSGWLPIEGDDESDPVNWRDSVDSAVSHIQEAINRVGDDDGARDALNTLLSTCNVLKKVPANSLVPTKARPNANGTTSDPLHVNTNQTSRTSGKHTIDVSQWENAATWMRLAQKYPSVFAAN